jgi:hypothetical protein
MNVRLVMRISGYLELIYAIGRPETFAFSG